LICLLVLMMFFLADEVHYNETGANFITIRYYNELVNVLEE